jgi:O-antigen ligase
MATRSEQRHEAFGVAKAIFASPRLTAALTSISIGTAVFTFALHQLIGWAGLIGILSGLVVLTVVSLSAQWREIGWSGLLPISLIVFIGWAGVSIFWSQYHWATLAGLAYLLAFTVLGIFVALARDTIQIVRSFGDVLRLTLALSLAVEILSGLLINKPFALLGVDARIAFLGPITGLQNTSDQLGLTAVIALITFGTELRTRSIERGWGIASVILGSIVLVLTRAPLAFGAMLVVFAAAAALYGLRRAPAPSRRYLQLALVVVVLALAVLAWIYRNAIVAFFNAGGALTYRLTLWHQVIVLTQSKPLQGWGWVGAWPIDTTPFAEFADPARFPGSALNAYIDVWFQLGIIGFVIFIGFLGLALVRSWLLASRRRSIVFAWPALVLVVLFIGSFAESFTLVEFGWLALVVCSVKASRELSWRTAFESMALPLRE